MNRYQLERKLQDNLSEADKVFAYASIDKKSRMFNAFFEKEGEYKYDEECLQKMSSGEIFILR